MSREKYTTQPTTCLVVFSIACNTAQRRFNVPESKPKKLDVDRPVPKGPLSFARIPVTASSELRSEMELWLEVRAGMNGASWYDAAHHAISISGATDVSFIFSGGVVQRPSGSAEVFRAAADFPAEWVRSHINVKEAFALYEVLRLVVNSRPDSSTSTHYYDRRRQ